MNEEDLCFLPATELAPMIRQKKISPVEVMSTLIKRIEHLEPKINAMAAFNPELAMDRARKAEDALLKGAALGPLHGLPVTIKDLAWTTDFPTESGSHINKGFQSKIYGRVPNHPVGAGDYTSHIGPMTRTVGDGALMMQVMSGPHPLDHTSLEAWPADYTGRLDDGVKGRRIAFSMDLGHANVDPEVADIVRRAAQNFAANGGFTMTDVNPAWGPVGKDLARTMWSAHMTRTAAQLPKFEHQMDPGLVACIRDGMKVSMADYQDARMRKLAYCADIQVWFEDWDFLITPTVSVAAFPAEKLIPDHWPQHAWDWLQWAEFSYPFNMSWNPAATVPAGFTKDGLPVGLQIVGRRFDDLGVMQAARAFERIQPWADKRPKMDW